MTHTATTQPQRHLVRTITTAMRSAYRTAMPRHELRRYVGEAAGIQTYCSVNELLMLAEEALDATQVSHSTGNVLEIGSYLGASAVVLGETLRRTHGTRGRVYCIDTWMNDAMTEGSRDTFAQFTANTSRWSDIVTALRGSSLTVNLPTVAMDLVFVDGDHSYEGATADIARFAPLVSGTGRLVLHDHRSKRGVTRALGELLATGQWEISRCVENIISLRRAR
jgi:predicted O-methyltransferase YrrM